jgi:hypothetical protein
MQAECEALVVIYCVYSPKYPMKCNELFKLKRFQVNWKFRCAIHNAGYIVTVDYYLRASF